MMDQTILVQDVVLSSIDMEHISRPAEIPEVVSWHTATERDAVLHEGPVVRAYECIWIGVVDGTNGQNSKDNITT